MRRYLVLVAALANGLTRPPMPRAAARGRCRAAAPTDGGGAEGDGARLALPRRATLGALACAAVTGAGVGAARAAPMAETTALLWRGSDAAVACGGGRATRLLGPRFVNYLARFLLAYDVPSRKLWRARSEEIPLSWTSAEVARKREAQLSEFVGAVEGGLCAYLPPEDGRGGAVDWARPEARSRIRQLFSLLRARYGERTDAKRQIALLFCLLTPPAQPTSSIVDVVAKAEDRDVREVLVLDGGRFYDTREGAAPRLDAPVLPRPAALGNLTAAALPPSIAPTGALAKVVVTYPGQYDAPPVVAVSPPQFSDEGAETRTATVRAIVRNGFVGDVEILDGGAGYSERDRVRVEFAAPARGGRASAAYGCPEYAAGPEKGDFNSSASRSYASKKASTRREPPKGDDHSSRDTPK